MSVMKDRVACSTHQSGSPQIIEARLGFQEKLLCLCIGLVFCGGAIALWSKPGACFAVASAGVGCICLFVFLRDLLRPHRLALTPDLLRVQFALGRKTIRRDTIAWFEEDRGLDGNGPQIDIMDRTGWLIWSLRSPWIYDEASAWQLREQLARHYPEIPWKSRGCHTPEQLEEMRLAETLAVEAEDSPSPACLRLDKDGAGRPLLLAVAKPGIELTSMLLLATVICMGSAILSGREAFRGDWLLGFFMLLFGGLAAVLWVVVAESLSRTRITFEPGCLRVTRRIGPLARNRSLPVREIKEVSYEQYASLGRRRWYAVIASMADGHKVRLASMIPGEAATRWFVRQVTKRIGNP